MPAREEGLVRRGDQRETFWKGQHLAHDEKHWLGFLPKGLRGQPEKVQEESFANIGLSLRC